jgi:2-(1,2-epoxy-1,2-dihydrophenyl)acetyl-CoA isomerase
MTPDTSTRMAFRTLDVQQRDGICTVTMNRPDKLNAMNVDMRRELGDCFCALAQDAATRVIVLTGAGRAFSAGGDINDFRQSPHELHRLMANVSHRWFRAFWNLPQPVIGAINGAAGGGGCNLALACDLIYASESAYFVNTFLDIGLMPDLGGAFMLPRLVGMARAKEMALLGERIEAQRALAMGLVNGVYAQDRLLDEVLARARRLAARSPESLCLTKRAMNRSFESSMEGVLDLELAAQSFLFNTPENRSGVERFLGSRGASRTAGGED